MTLSDLGNLGEFFASVGVLISLVYVDGVPVESGRVIVMRRKQRTTRS